MTYPYHKSYLQSNFNGMGEGMGSENKTFMITGRYASSQSTLLDVQEEEEEAYEQPVFGDEDEELAEDETNIGNEDLPNYGSDSYYNWKFDDNENQNNDPVHNEQHIPDENNSFDKETHNNKDGEEAAMEMPEGVEQLTQEDIRIFLENESVVAALQASQEVTGHHAPHLNMKAGNYKGKNIGNAIGTRRTYTCSKFGKVVAPEVIEERKKRRQERNQEKAGSGPPPKTRKRRRNINPVSGCKAKMVVTLKGDKWVVTNLELHHNHELSRPDESKFLASHRHMTDQEKLFIRTFTSVKLPARKIMAILTYLRGGKPKNVPYNKKYVSNVMTAIRLEDITNDMMKVLSYFRQRQEEDPRFYYNFDLGEGNKVKCIFWSDGFSRHMYDLYGDCLSFDTTFKINKYNLPFAPFVGVTGHGHNCLFSCAIINNEQASTFEWLFEEFLICMGGKHPATIITDGDWPRGVQDAAMARAINEVFKQSCHRNCFFHIKRKSEEKCGGSFSNMWENRKKFVPVYFKHNFLPFIHSTARSEGTNAIFKDNVGSTYSVISFLGEYQKISENIEELEREHDSVTRITEPDYWVRSEIELQAGRMYEVYKTPMLQPQDFRSRKYLVSVNLQAQEFASICCKFEKDDIICAHILRVLIHLNLSELSEKYYISRWRPKDRKYMRDKQSIPIDLKTSNKHLRYCVLSRKFCNISSEGAVTERKYLFLLDEIKRIEDRLDEMTQEDETAKFQKRGKGKQPCATSEQQKTSEQQHKDGFPDNLQDPDVVPSKGRPETSKRQRTFVEELMSKNQITCSHCGSHQHNIATCTMRHIPKSFFEKSVKTSNKKTAGKADGENTTKKQTQKRNQAKSTGNMKKTSSKS
ncbi:protein FAR1-RELATED SEQUENCE 5-like [Lolium rigidum]|uniref:protein FAR1-RELATED SEQUENCE 5-like n=1 Tax=Lolium rigidum TaxID=89674 RepID=UPI001F5D588E|nr:protein FAR1-RELATED SEQUENCE 5-like [Lolium rigidum]